MAWPWPWPWRPLLTSGRLERNGIYNFPIAAVKDAMKLVMENNIFEFGDMYFEQLTGTAMGTSAACMFMWTRSTLQSMKRSYSINAAWSSYCTKGLSMTCSLLGMAPVSTMDRIQSRYRQLWPTQVGLRGWFIYICQLLRSHRFHRVVRRDTYQNLSDENKPLSISPSTLRPKSERRERSCLQPSSTIQTSRLPPIRLH